MESLLILISGLVIGFTVGSIATHYFFVEPYKKIARNSMEGWGESLTTVIELGMKLRSYEKNVGVKSPFQVDHV